MATRERLVAAAREVLLTEGAAAVSIRRVAADAGVAPMTIYRHFTNRDGLLQEVAEASFAEIAERWASRERPDDLDEWVRGLLDDHLDFALRQPRLYDFVFTESRAQARQFPDDFRAGRSPSLNLAAQAISEGMERRILRQDDVWEIALTFAALVHGLVALYRGGRIGLSEPEFRELCHSAVGRIFDGLKR